jgi:hypothetical protein
VLTVKLTAVPKMVQVSPVVTEMPVDVAPDGTVSLMTWLSLLLRQLAPARAHRVRPARSARVSDATPQ